MALAACGSDAAMTDTTSTPSTAAATVVTTADSTSTTTLPRAFGVVLVGDSLAVEASRYLGGLLDDPADDLDVTLSVVAIGGTAPCDFVDADLPFADAAVVVLSFNGNALTDCIRGDDGTRLPTPALVERYRADLATLVERARAAGADVVLVDQPIRRDDDVTNRLIGEINSMIREFADEASAGDVTVSMAGATVETSEGAFALRLPCLAGEESCDADGTNVVRNDDGVHFCPGVGQWNGGCGAYASGAYRFALAIATSVLERLRTG